MNDVDGLLAEAFDDLGRRAPHHPDLAGAVRQRARRQRAVLASAVAVLALVGTTAVAVAGRLGDPAPTLSIGSGTAEPPATGCAPPETGVLPEWARTGFSTADPGIPFVRGADGDILAILFGHPLLSPPGRDRSNKVLWVARTSSGPGPLVIEAQLEGSDLRVRREVANGPGPSTVDLPAPGCWQLDLSWGASADTVALEYAPG